MVSTSSGWSAFNAVALSPDKRGLSSPVLPGPWSFRTLGQDQQQVTTQAPLQPAADYLK